MSDIRSVLFICTGNSCRSVMAEGLLKKRLKELGKSGITVRSAGVRAISGFPPTDETVKVMNAQGVDVGSFKSAQLTDELIKSSDLILVMSRPHKLEIVRRVPYAATKTFLLREYGRPASEPAVIDLDIPDPIGGPESVYETCVGIIKENIERVAKLL